MTDDEVPKVRIYQNPVPDRDLGMGVAIAGTSAIKPPKLLTDEVIEHFIENFDYERVAKKGKTFAQIRREKVGTELIYETTHNYTIEDCAAEAGLQAIERAGLKLDDIAELHMSCLSSTDKIARSRSYVIEKMGFETAPTFEFSHGCAGSLFTLESARRAVLVKGKPVLGLAFDDVRKYVIDLKDWAQAGIFGAAAAAVVYVPTDKGVGVYPLNFWTDPAVTRLACMNKMTEKFHMEGKELGEFAPATYTKFFEQVVKEYDLDINNIIVAPHQVNGHLIELFRQKTGLSKRQVINVVNRYSNTSNPSVYIAVNHAATNRLRPGDVLIIFGVGAGFDFGYTILKPDRSLILPKTLKILLADDDTDLLESKVEGYEAFLGGSKNLPEHISLEFYTAASGEEAIEKARDIQPDLLDFDMRMGGMNGAEAIIKIHRDIGPRPSIINSAYGDEEDVKAYDQLMKLTNFETSYIMKNGGMKDYSEKILDFLFDSNII